MNAATKRMVFLLLSLVLPGMITGVSGQADQTIYTQYCVAQPDTSCFEPANGAVDSVGRDVAALGGNFRFCLELDTIDTGFAPIRVMLLLDESGSMCSVVDWVQCCEVGDSSGYCMYNDPTNQRVIAAHLFVDSLRAQSPLSEVGVINYVNRVDTHNPLPLNSDNNVAQIHEWIDDAACPETNGLGKTTRTTATYLGLALETGLRLVDTNYDQLAPFMSRHIILLTDGAWDDINDRSPESILNAYAQANPNRTIPQVHGVFLSDTALHIEHGYPPVGCSTTDYVDLSYLQSTTVATGGLYFPGSTPQSIVSNFQMLLDSVTRTVSQQLVELIVTNNTTGAVNSTRTATQINANAVWESRLDNLPLVFGANNLEVRQRIYSPSLGDTITKVSNVVIIRSTLYREALDTDLFNEYCVFDSASLTLSVTPEVNLQNDPFDVEATISNAQDYNLDTTQLRIFTRFPDNETGVLATFHLDGDLANAGGGAAGTGSPTFISDVFLFGSGAITAGNFSYQLAQLNGNFVMEAWINPEGNSGGVLFSGTGYNFGINDRMQLYFNAGSENVATAMMSIDDGVWSHIAVARTNGNVQLFINGVAVTEPVAFSTAIGGDEITVSAPNRWSVDEVRFSNNSRVSTQGENTTLRLPTIATTEWILAGTTSKSEALTVPPAVWTQNGRQLDLQFSSPVSGRILVNMRPKNSGNTASAWSKNSNPVRVADDLEGPYVKRGVLTPAAIDGKNDTLLIEFNEPVSCEELIALNPDRVFVVSNEQSIDQNGALNGSDFLGENICTEAFVSSITFYVPTYQITPEEDSIRIILESITDQAGNAAQTDKKGEIVWGEGSELEVISIPSIPGSNLEINQTVKRILGITESNGKVVQVRTRRGLDTLGTTAEGKPIYGKVTIFDPVGNLVKENQNVFEADSGKYFYVWNGLNRTGRRVGSGPYLLVFKFKFPNGIKIFDKKKIALRW